MDDMLVHAVRNNAAWCARICALHRAGGRMGYAAWSTLGQAPRYYPNVVTLRPDCVTAQLALVTSLARLRAGWGVKDSFVTLDLEPLGFRAAIEGRWLRHRPRAAGGGLAWRVVGDPLALLRWEAAWGGEAHRSHARIFFPALLDDAAATVFGGYDGEEVVAGGILYRAEGAAGLSNVFARSPEETSAVVARAGALAGDLPMVGWESGPQAGDAEDLGPLRVWLQEGRGD